MSDHEVPMESESASESVFTEEQQRVIAEIQRVASMLCVDRLSQNDFDKHHQVAGLSTAGYQFGSWNRAVRAAGLQPNEPGNTNTGPKFSDEELLGEIVRLQQQLGKEPSEREMARFGQYSPKPYRDRWGTWAEAKKAAYARYGMPERNGS